MIAFVFPGQGSQSKGMGGKLFDDFPELTAKADEILGYSIKELCMEDPNSNLAQTQFTQPALYIVNALSYLKKISETGEKPDYLAGHSLGEYNALFAAGAFDFERGLRLVKQRGELMNRATGGAMAAVIGLNNLQIADILAKNNLRNVDIANYNSLLQIVISGPKADIEQAKTVFEGLNEVKLFVPLKTSGAFHSRYMKDVQQEYEIFLSDFHFDKLNIPVISNVDARPYKDTEIKQNLIAQIVSPVKWADSVLYLLSVGVIQFEELGNGKVLTGLINKVSKKTETLISNG